jgi:peptide deformylase
MAILKVARLGNPILRCVAEAVAVSEIGSAATQRFIDDLIETMYEYDGAGLAAPQVHVSKRIVTYAVDESPRYPDAPSIPLTVLINPEIEILTREVDEDWEGCLSVPDLRGKVPRYRTIGVKAYDRAGRTFRFKASDFHARVVQHECDHLDGKLYIDRMRSMESLTFVREFIRYQGGATSEA